LWIPNIISDKILTKNCTFLIKAGKVAISFL
jgi:hypothetical protein